MNGYLAYPILETTFLLLFKASSIHDLKERPTIWYRECFNSLSKKNLAELYHFENSQLPHAYRGSNSVLEQKFSTLLLHQAHSWEQWKQREQKKKVPLAFSVRLLPPQRPKSLKEYFTSFKCKGRKRQRK